MKLSNISVDRADEGNINYLVNADQIAAWRLNALTLIEMKERQTPRGKASRPPVSGERMNKNT